MEEIEDYLQKRYVSLGLFLDLVRANSHTFQELEAPRRHCPYFMETSISNGMVLRQIDVAGERDMALRLYIAIHGFERQ